MTKRVHALAAVVALLGTAGCKPQAREISPLQRREAASLVSEAHFALSVRDLARAEVSLAKAVALSPDLGDYWLELGRCRVKLGNRGAAKDAYKSALAAYEADAKREPAARAQAIVRQIYVLALLGRADDGRALLAKALKDDAGNSMLREFSDTKQIDGMLASPAFKEAAL